MRSSMSNVTEVFYDHMGDPVEIYPRFCVDETLVQVGASSRMAGGISLLDQMRRKPDSTICFWRTYALGDILLLTPIFNWLKDEYPACRILLATSSRFMTLFQYWDDIHTIGKRSVLHRAYDVGYHLDGIVERDHSGGPQSYKHRLDLYSEFMGIPVPKDPLFSLPYSDVEEQWAKDLTGELRLRGKPILVMQVFGSTKVKSFSLDKVMRIAAALSSSYIVILVHSGRETMNGDEVVNMTGQTTVHQLAALINCADAVVTMDSGVLWIAHCTQTPMIALLGPTREQERLVYHRNYHLVDLAKMVGCEACFERQGRCEGRIDCMNRSNEDQIVTEIQEGVLKLVAS